MVSARVPSHFKRSLPLLAALQPRRTQFSSTSRRKSGITLEGSGYFENFCNNLYGCETWSLTLREERRLRVFENRVLRRVFGPKRYEVTRD